MCLGVPAKVLDVTGRSAKVIISGTTSTVDLRLVTGVEPGSYVIVHAGFAIERLDTDKAEATLKLIEEACS